MKIKYLTFVLLAVLAACSKDEADFTTAEQSVPHSAGNSIVLGVKEVVSPATRAAQVAGSMNFEQLKTTGFGVYGYKGEYDNGSSTPTLFGNTTNTHVTFITGGTSPSTLLDIPGSWDYTNSDADNLVEWEEDEKYTFFAYAPYMADNGTAPGITTIKAASDVSAGDPTIGYTVSTDPASSVDLLWGVRTDSEEKAGLPWIDIQRGKTTSAVLFTFYHALCALGLHAQVIVDQQNRLGELDDESYLGTIGDKDGCKVTLKSITIAPRARVLPDVAEPFHQSATLNLNNTTAVEADNYGAHQPLWTSHSGTISSLILDDGSTDGHGTIDSRLLDPKTDDFSSPNPTNYDVMDDDDYDTEVPGITESANSQTVIALDGSGKEQFYMLIPQDAQDYTVTVEYFLTYKTGESSPGVNTYHREAITASATISDLELIAGVKYYINLVIGLTTFKVSIDAVDWDESTVPVTIATETSTSASESLAKRLRLSDREK